MNEYRTHRCRDLGTALAGERVKVAGWMANVRDHGGLVFVDVRDQSGRVQVVLPRDDETMVSLVRQLGRESVISVGARSRSALRRTATLTSLLVILKSSPAQ
ncbi:MAG: OB-fold nucleic acid binding domain-containing protein [Pseudonocardiaceae bacterium]